MSAVQLLTTADEAILVHRARGSERLTIAASGASVEPHLPNALQNLNLPSEFESRWFDGDNVLPGSSRLLVGLPMYAPPSRRVALLLRFRGPTEDAKRVVERVLPGVRSLLSSYLDLMMRHRHAQRQRRAALAVMQQDECGVVVLRADRTVVMANAAAETVLSCGDCLTMAGGTLRSISYSDAVRFHTAIDCVSASGNARGADRSPGIVMFLPRAGKDPLLTVVTPATRSQSDEAAAVVYFLDASQNAVHGLIAICKAHGLSAVETRLVTHLVGGSTITEAAASMRIKPATARSYLKQVFAKTNTHRQVDLIQRFARYLRAIRGGFEFQPG